MSPEQEERFVAAVERIGEAFDYIAGTLESMNKNQSLDISLRFPPKRIPEEATITQVKSEEDKLRESQGATGESLRDWTNLRDEEITGPREAAWLEEQERRTKAGKKP